MKASPNNTVYYRNSIRTITAVRTTLTYVVKTMYSRGYHKNAGVWTAIAIPSAELYTPNITNLSWYIGSISSRPLLENQRSVHITDGNANSPVSWGSLPSYLTIEGVDTESKVELYINLSFDKKVVLQVRAIYTHNRSHLIFPIYIPRALRSKHQP
jgi:hypothetical protein